MVLPSVEIAKFEAESKCGRKPDRWRHGVTPLPPFFLNGMGNEALRKAMLSGVTRARAASNLDKPVTRNGTVTGALWDSNWTETGQVVGQRDRETWKRPQKND